MKSRAGPFFAALALAGVLALAVFPTTAWLDQRRNRESLTAQLSTLNEENRAFEARAAELQSDEEIERLARQYNLVKPGEEAYFILPRAEQPPAASPPEPAAEAETRSRSLWERITDLF
jgi:hypothetical protein